MLRTIRQIMPEPIPSVGFGRQLAEPDDVTRLRLSMRSSLRPSHDYDEHPNIVLEERTVEFTADIELTTSVEYIFDHVLYENGWRLWEIQHHPELKRTTYKLWLYPNELASKAMLERKGL